mgnify:CR=1 FL=1
MKHLALSPSFLHVTFIHQLPFPRIFIFVLLFLPTPSFIPSQLPMYLALLLALPFCCLQPRHSCSSKMSSTSLTISSYFYELLSSVEVNSKRRRVAE